jgi:hypothetical protein
MEKQNYYRTITVKASSAESMKNIIQVNHWWKHDFSGSAEKLMTNLMCRLENLMVRVLLLILLSANLCQTKKLYGKLLIVICLGSKAKRNEILPKLFLKFHQ